jgi:hypothetical protein
MVEDRLALKSNLQRQVLLAGRLLCLTEDSLLHCKYEEDEKILCNMKVLVYTQPAVQTWCTSGAEECVSQVPSQATLPAVLVCWTEVRVYPSPVPASGLLV